MLNPMLYIAEGFALGLATGPACVAFCGPVYVPYLMQKSRTTLQSIATLVQISAGRFATYLLLGIAAGTLGTNIGSQERVLFTATAYILFSVVLVVSAFRTGKCDEGCRVAGWTRFSEVPFLLGMATGISFCPSLLLALTKAVEQGGALAGALLLTTFFIGTNIYFVPFVLFGIIGKTYRLRTIARIVSCMAALWFIGQGIVLLTR
jgi:sulfite exporter TauE/SafE